MLVCSSWVPGNHRTEQWLALNAARAIENSVYVAGVCQALPVSVGRSILIDPMGVRNPISGWKRVFGRWMSRWRRCTVCGSRFRCSGSGGCRWAADKVLAQGLR
ncbi:nitrilase-related carbon-nitrogen hydrolase [Arthrobacter sp. SAFR-014]|uniref:nitrilase-related carbon-nitrogen hydrolase n=1 Tax=unclassified Arthrobacter TaxID=235627 RepID=UPI003F7C6BFF